MARPCYPAEDGERGGLRPDRLLHLIMNDRRAADVEGQAAAQFRSEGLRNLLLHSACQAGHARRNADPRRQIGYRVSALAFAKGVTYGVIPAAT